MTPLRYLVIQCGGALVIRSGNRTFGPSSDHVHATDAAIDFAGKDGRAGRPRKFWLDLRTRLVPQHARQSCKWPGQRAYRLP